MRGWRTRASTESASPVRNWNSSRAHPPLVQACAVVGKLQTVRLALGVAARIPGHFQDSAPKQGSTELVRTSHPTSTESVYDFKAPHGREGDMDYCDHCDGQRFDRARVLQALRRLRRQLRTSRGADGEMALSMAVAAVRALDIPHLEPLDFNEEIIH